MPTLSEVLTAEQTAWQAFIVPGWYGAGARTIEIASATAMWRHAGLPVVPIRLRRLCRRSLRDRIDAVGIDGC